MTHQQIKKMVLVCILVVHDADYLEYDENANDDDGSCLTLAVAGCTDASAPKL